MPALIAILMWLLSVEALGQSRQTADAVRLRPLEARLNEEFSVITSVRELSDGRVLVTDEKDSRVVVADFRSDEVSPLGRRGSGPGEYTQVGRVWPLGGDSSLLKEPFAPRWIIFDGTRIVRTAGAGDPATLLVGGTMVQGTDARGGVVATRVARDASGRPVPADSYYVVRVERSTMRVDTVARVESTEGWAAEARVSRNAPPVAVRGASSSGRRSYVLSFFAPDQLAVFPDGWIAIARANPYRVDWCEPGKRCRIGPRLHAEHLPMSAREKRAYLEVASRTHSWPPTTDVSETSGWPDAVPAFVTPTGRIDGSAVLPMSDGRLLIERLPTADAMWMRYDLVTRTGELAGQVRLPLGERIVGQGVRSLYVTVTDSIGVQRLQRHPWP